MARTTERRQVVYPWPVLIPIFNIFVGAALIVAGASGKATLLGTNSSTALYAVGAVVALIGVIQAVRAARGR